MKITKLARLASFKVALLASTIGIAQPAFAQTSQENPGQPNASDEADRIGVADTAATIAEIVVTAQKREQNLQDVPISITAFTETAIVANRIQDVRDLNALAPNLTVRLSTGGGQIPNFSLRGLYTSGTAAGTDKGVALYLDGVYIQSVIGSVFDFADIERIEVLKGPQGTLFGRNSTGGAISITTRNPTGEFAVKQDLTYGNYDQFRSKTRVDLPALGPLSASITYLHSQRRGDTRNLGAGTTLDYRLASPLMGVRVSPEYLGSDNVEAVAATLKLDAFDGLDLIYKFDYSENNYTPNAQGSNYVQTGGIVATLRAASPNPMTPLTSLRPDAVNNAFTTPSRLWSYGHNFTAQYRVNDAITIKNIASYRKSSLTSSFQLDGTGGLVNIAVGALPGGRVLTLANVTNTSNRSLSGGGAAGVIAGTGVIPPGTPFVFLSNNTFNRERQWSDEFQVNISTKWFELTAGYIHFDNHIATGGAADLYNTLQTTALYGQGTTSFGTAFVMPKNTGFIPTEVTSISDAFYIQPEFHLTDRLDIVGGARITKDRKTGFEVAPDQWVATGNAAVPRATVSRPISYRDSQQSFMVGLNYRPTDDILVYVKYADGYISGGQLATIPFEPEKAFSYEAGIKADLFDRRFRSNLAVFKVDYQNVQSTTSGQLTGVASSFLYGQAVISAADATAKGFEWENTIVPVRGVTLTGNLGYTDFKYDPNTVYGGPTATGGVCRGPTCTGGFVLTSGSAGYLPLQRPKWTANVAAQYDTLEIVGGGHLTFRVDANFKSKNLMASDLSVGNTLGEAPSAIVRASATSPAQWLVNARAGLVDFDLGGTKVDLSVWGKNILNNRHIVQFTALGPVSSVIYERAPTYGVDLRVSF